MHGAVDCERDQPWYALGSPTTALAYDLVILRGATGNQELYSVDSSRTVWEKWYTPSARAWSAWSSLGSPS